MKRSMCGLGVVGLACAGVLLEAEPAAACGETPCAQQSQTLPIDTALPVPINTELRIEYKGFVDPEEAGIGDCSIPIDQMRLTPVGGEPSDIPAALERDRGDYPSTWAVAHPAGLQPNTEYVVTSLHKGDGQCSCEEPEWVEIMRFMTSDERDDRPPVAPEPFGSSFTIALISETTCGRSQGFTASIDIDAPEDASPHARYNVYADGQVMHRYVSPGGTQVRVNCVDDPARPGQFIADTKEIEIRAVDIAGNEAQEGTTLSIDDSCDAIADAIAAIDRDASVEPAPDAGMVDAVDADGGQPSRPVVPAMKPDDRGGDVEDCSASGASGGGWTTAWIALAFVLARARRGRR